MGITFSCPLFHPCGLLSAGGGGYFWILGNRQWLPRCSSQTIKNIKKNAQKLTRRCASFTFETVETVETVATVETVDCGDGGD